MVELGHVTTVFSSKCIENSFYAIQGIFRSLEMYLIGAMKFVPVGHPRGTLVFSKLPGLQYYFVENAI